MEKEFVPYELAVKLKELGCNVFINYTTHDPYPTENSNILWQQAFDWFREVHCLHGFIDNTSIFKKGSYHVHINKTNIEPTSRDCNRVRNKLFVDSYQEAKKYCLEELIKLIVK